MVKSTELEYFLCRILKRFLFVSCRFPAFKQAYIKRNIDKPTTSKEDLECYLSNSTSTGRKRALFLVIIYITYCFKNAYIPYQSFSTLDYENLESNIKTHPVGHYQPSNSENSTSFKSFACLWTNCSRLSTHTPHDVSAATNFLTNQNHDRRRHLSALSELAHDVIVLPLFALCSPIAEVLYTPAVKLDSVGVLISAAACLNVFLLGSYTTIQQFIAPAPNEMIMFICAPKVTAQISRSRASQLFFDLIASFHNFRFKPVWQPERANSIRRIRAQYGPPSARDNGPANVVPSSHPLLDLMLYRGGSYEIEDVIVHPRKESRSIQALIEQADDVCCNEQMVGFELTGLTGASGRTVKRHNLSFEGRTQEEIEDITRSCLPIIRTEWNRAYTARIFNHTLFVAMLVIGLVGLGAINFITYRAHIKSHELHLVASEIKRQNCSLWRVSQSSDSAAMTIRSLVETGEVIELDRMDFGWTWFAMLLAFVNLIPGFTVAVLFAYYWTYLSELSIWLAELRMFLVASLVVAKYKMSPAHNALELSDDVGRFANRLRRISHEQHRSRQLGLGQLPAGSDLGGLSQKRNASITGRLSHLGQIPNTVKTDHFYNIKPMREKFQSECWFIYLNFLSRFEKDNGERETGFMNSRRTDQRHFRHFVDQLLFHRTGSYLAKQMPSKRTFSLCSQHALHPLLPHLDDLTSELECMEQIYINYRLFVESVLGCTPSVKVVLAITYLLNYGLVFIAIMCSRKMATLKAEPMCIIVFGWFISNYLILLGANFHADAKKLQPLLWSIIAQLTHSNNLRVQHMRYLWTKQAQMLDDSGGLALSAFGLRVTYVNIIQLALGTATIIVISIRPN